MHHAPHPQGVFGLQPKAEAEGRETDAFLRDAEANARGVWLLYSSAALELRCELAIRRLFERP